ncbi:MAG: hypothetical protein N5P05_004342 (plasmid) [Chroococcopsis gigantea SAG 12.99]|jgi:5-methylcytosine-specific restriction endonuclease McrA|nr:hypothetical protein [Chroococcopsis gigantea SAG 12.99]
MSKSRYPKDWKKLAFRIKEAAGWKCQKCHRQCIRPGDDISGLSKSERGAKTLVVHHFNYLPEDNRPENLIAVCSPCHLGFHNRGQGNVTLGQLNLFDRQTLTFKDYQS